MTKRTIRKFPTDDAHEQGRLDERIIVVRWLEHLGHLDLAHDLQDKQHYDYYFRGNVGRRSTDDGQD